MLVGRVGLSPVMIGRAGPLDRLLGLVDAADIGAGDLPYVALVSGEAGIGKTRLLRELSAAAADDATVLTVQAQPGSIGRAFHAVAQLAPDGDPATAAFEVVRAAATSRPTVLLVEDLHWADADSVNVLDAITEAPWPRLVVIGTYRPSDLSRGSPGGELVLRLERRHAVEQVRLDRLDRSDVGAMLQAIAGAPPGSAAVEAVHRRSAGIPFVVEELVRAAPDCLDDLATAQLPWSLDEAVRQQVAGLQTDERRVVEALAVFGRPTAFDALTRVTGLDERALVAALRPLVSRDVISEPAEDVFWFDHALLAEAVLQQLLGRERRALHEAAADALRAQPAPDASALAEHLHGAGRYDEAVAVARASARGYLDRGASFQALRLAGPALAEQPDDLELLAVATEAAWRLDFNDEALQYARRWVDHSSSGVGLIDALRMFCRLHIELGLDEGRDEILARMEALAETIEPGAPRARLRAALAQLNMMLVRSETAVRWADAAIAEATALGDEYVATQAGIERGSALWGVADIPTAKATLAEAIERAHALGDGVLEARGINNMLEYVPLHSDEARRLLDTLFRLTDRIGFDKLSLDARDWELLVHTIRGDMAGFRRVLDEMRPLWRSRAHGLHRFVSHAAYAAAFLALEEGRVDDARQLLTSVGPLAPATARPSDLFVYALFAALTNDTDLAVATIAARRAAPPTIESDAVLVNRTLILADSALSAGVDPAVVAAVEWPAGTVDHVQAFVVAASDRPGDAVDALRRVLSAPDEAMSLPMQATARLALATALLATGARDEAREEARRARDVELAGWPGWRRDRADALLRRLEGTRRSEGVLTSREREVAALIAEGMTNGQLAERLYISPKTAAVHVSNILTKLGLSGRAEVAAWAVRNGVVAVSAGG